MTRKTVLLVVSALALAAPAVGQELQPGTRVRVTAPIVHGGSRFVGTVASTSGGRILLRLDPTIRQDAHGDTISIPRSLVRQVEVSLGPSYGHGRRDAARTGALAGLAAGVGLGMVFGAGSDRNGVKNPWTTSLWLGPALGAIGAGTGALVGSEEHEQWRVVPPSGVAGLPLGRNVTVSIRLGF